MNAPAPDLAAAGAERAQALLQRLRHELAHPPFHALLNPEAVSVDADTGVVVIRLPYRPALRRAAGSENIHGGVIAALIDMAAHASVAVQTGRMAPTVDLRIDYLKPAPGADLYATAKVLRLGRAIARADVEISHAPGAAPCAVGRGTFSTLDTGGTA
ncbi:PaaI family thioesterase [Bordetella bronchialis]|uniref:PaaI family thioesterase n=1 Tax=Bordetella bronchialis TaxID=463025 RepID=UPI0009F5DB9D|nr:PaaI family thioesterase [Bordetella bronchialis]